MLYNIIKKYRMKISYLLEILLSVYEFCSSGIYDVNGFVFYKFSYINNRKRIIVIMLTGRAELVALISIFFLLDSYQLH